MKIFLKKLKKMELKDLEMKMTKPINTSRWKNYNIKINE